MKPYLKDGVLIIPFDCDQEYKYWEGEVDPNDPTKVNRRKDRKGILEILVELNAPYEVLRHHVAIRDKCKHGPVKTHCFECNVINLGRMYE